MARTGQAGAVESAPRVIRDERGVVTTLREWRGLLDEVQVVADTLSTPYEIAHDRGPIYRLTTGVAGNQSGGASPPAPEDLVIEVWDLKVSQMRRDLWELPKVRTELEKITWRDARAQALADLRAIASGDIVVTQRRDASGQFIYETDAAGTLTSTVSTARLTSAQVIAYLADAYGCDATVLQGFSDELSRGVDSYHFDTFVLSRKRVGPDAASTLLAEYDAVNRIFRTTTVLSEYPLIPASIRTRMVAQLSAGYWMRQADEIQQLDAARSEVTSQWTYAPAYSTFIYGDPS